MKDNLPTIAFTDIDPVVSGNLTSELKGEFQLKDFSKESAPDIIVFDIEVEGGLEELETLRKAEPGIPILVLASIKSPSLLERALTLEDVDFVIKPIDTEELKLRAKRLLRPRKHIVEPMRPLALERPILKEDLVPGANVRIVKFALVPLRELHGQSGRLDAAAIADYLAVPLAKLAKAIGVNYATLHKTPDSPAVQSALDVIKRILIVLSEMLGKRETVLAWLNSSHPDLGNRSPLGVILEGHADAVLTILENARAGVPS